MTSARNQTLPKVLTKIKAATASIVRDALYEASEAGVSRNAYQRERGAKKHTRAVAKLKRLLTKAQNHSASLNGDIRSAVLGVAETTRAIVASCDYFPNNKEWPGQAPLQEQVALIAEARRLARAS